VSSLKNWRKMKGDLFEIKRDLSESYLKNTPHKLKLIDVFILYLLILTLFQAIYYVVGGKDPFEAFLSGIFTSLGTMAFTSNSLLFYHFIVCLRIQVNPDNDYHKKGHKTKFERAVAQYFITCFVLFLAALNFMR